MHVHFFGELVVDGDGGGHQFKFLDQLNLGGVHGAVLLQSVVQAVGFGEHVVPVGQHESAPNVGHDADVGDDVQLPADVLHKVQAFLAARPCAAAHHLRELRLGRQRFEHVRVLDVEQVDALFKFAVQNNKPEYFALLVGRLVLLLDAAVVVVGVVAGVEQVAHPLLYFGRVDVAPHGARQQHGEGVVRGWFLQLHLSVCFSQDGGVAHGQKAGNNNFCAVAGLVHVGVDKVLVHFSFGLQVGLVQALDVVEHGDHFGGANGHGFFYGGGVKIGVVEFKSVGKFAPIAFFAQA